MFNEERIRSLEIRADYLEGSRDRLWTAIQALRTDLDRLAEHLGLKFENVNERQLVAIKTLEKFKK